MKRENYKDRLEDRFLELLEDFKSFDKEVVQAIPSQLLEEIGSHISQANKIFNGIRHELPFMDMKLKEKITAKKRNEGKR